MANELDELEALTQASTQAPQATGAAPAAAPGNELDDLANLTHAETDAVDKAASDDKFDETDYYRQNGKTDEALDFAVKVRQAKEAKPAEPLKAAGSFVKGVGEELGKTGEDIWEGGKAALTGKPHEAKSGLGSFVGGIGKGIGNLINSQDDPAGISKGKMMNGDEWLKATKERIDRYDRLKELQAEERQNFLKAGGKVQDFKSQIGILPEEEVSSDERAAYDRHAAAALESSAAIHLGAQHGFGLAIKGWRGATEWNRKDWTPDQWKERIRADAELRDTADTVKSGKLPDVERDGLTGMSRLSAMITPEVPDDVRQRLTKEGTYKPEDVEAMSGIADPTNLVLGEVLRLPIVPKIGGAALRMSGTGMKAIGSVADKMIGHGAGRGIALAGGGVVAYKVGEGVFHGDFKPLGVALALFGARSLLRRGGALVDDAGRELLNPEGFNSASATRAAGALADDAAAGSVPRTPTQGAVGNFFDGAQNSAAASRIARRTLQGAAIGVEGAVPFAALSDNPEQAGHAIGGGVAFGGALGPMGGIEPSLNRAMEINKAATSILAERGGAQTFADPGLQKAHDTAMADLPTGYQTYLNAMRGLVSGFRGRSGQPMNIAVLSGADFGREVAARSGAAPDAAATAHGYYDANSGTVFINKEGLRSRSDAAGHETGHFITDEVMGQMGRAYGDALRTAVEGGLFTGDKPTPAFKAFIDEYNKRTPGTPIPADKGKDDILRHRAVSEYLAETTRNILGEPNVGRFMLPKDVSDAMADKAVAMFGDAAGGGPKGDIFNRTDLPTIHNALKDVMFDLGRGLTPPARATGAPRPRATAGATAPEGAPAATGSPASAPGPRTGAVEPNSAMPGNPAEPFADIGVSQDVYDAVRDYHIAPPGMEPRTQRTNRKRGVEGKSADRIAEERGNEWDEMFSNYAEYLRTNDLQAPADPTDLHQAVIQHSLVSDPVARAHVDAVRGATPAEPVPAGATGALAEPATGVSSIESKTREGALAPVREPAPAAHTEQEISSRLLEAERQAEADPSFAKKREKGQAAAKKSARVAALLDVASEASGGDYDLLQRRTDAGGQVRFTGRLDPESILAHRMLLDELNIPADGQAAIELLNDHVGQTVYLDYKSAPKTAEGDISGTQRREEYQASPADARKAGGAHTEQKGKAFHITGFKVWPGKGSITLTGFSPDKWIANAHKLMEHVRAEGHNPGYTGVNDPHLATDMQGYAENHANGYKGDGSAPVEGREPTPGYEPWQIPQDRFDLLNAALNFDISNKADSVRAGARENAMEAQYRALDNGITPDEETGDVNPLRAYINKSGKLVSKNAKGALREGTGDHLENVFENISPDLVTGLSTTPDGQNIIRPVGYKGDPADISRQGIPRADYAAAGFMPNERSSIKSKGALTDETQETQAEYSARLKSDPQSVIEDHRNKSGVPVFNGDAIIYKAPKFRNASKQEKPMIAKELYPEAKEARDAALDHYLTGPVEKGGEALVMAGGIASGKTTISDRLKVPEFIYDTNLKNFTDATRNIDAILDSNPERKANIVFVDMEPEGTMRGNLKRSQTEDRIEYADDVGGSNADARTNIKRLAEHYAGNPRVTFTAFKNVRGLDPVEIPLSKVKDIPVDEARKRAHTTLNEIEAGTDQEWDGEPLSPETATLARGSAARNQGGLEASGDGARGVLSEQGNAPGAKTGGSPRGALAGSIAEFMPKEGASSIKSKTDELGFFSGLSRLVDSPKLPNRGTGEQMLNTLKSQGAKPEELEWTGTADFLKNHDGPVTKAQLRAFVEAGGVKLEEVQHATNIGKPEDISVHPDDFTWKDNRNQDGSGEIIGTHPEEDSRFTIRRAREEDWEYDPDREPEDQKWLLSGDWGDAFEANSAHDAKRIAAEYVERNLQERAQERLDEHGEEGNTKYKDYTLPGGENYKETLLTLPSEVETGKRVEEEEDGGWSIYNKNGELLEGGFQSEAAAKRAIKTDAEKEGKVYSSSHWDEDNVLAHIRQQDYTRDTYTAADARAIGKRMAEAFGYKESSFGSGAPEKGVKMGVITPEEAAQYAHFKGYTSGVSKEGASEKIRLIEEIQSDWHQAGRKEGYDEPLTPEQKAAESKRDAAGRELREIAKRAFPETNIGPMDVASVLERNLKLATEEPMPYERWKNVQAPAWREAWEQKYGGENWEEGARKAYETWLEKQKEWNIGIPKEEMEAVTKRARELTDEARAAGDEAPPPFRVPNAPFKKNWHELAFKRALRMAVEDGADRIAWTPGKEQAERYDLSKQVGILSFDPKANRLLAKSHGNATLIDKEVAPEKLADYVGKDVAKKLLETKPERGLHTLEGPSLKAGGEGMIGFYDKILPDFVKKYVKRWGGSVEKIAIDTPHDGGISGEDVMNEMGIPPGERHKFWREMEMEERNRLLEEHRKSKGKTEVWSVKITPEMRDAVMGEGQPMFMPKEPSSIKSKGALEDTPVDGLGFFSGLRKAAADRLQAKSTPEQVLGVLDPAKGGVKKEELEVVGLPQFLEGKASVSKQEVLDFIDANSVKLKEEVKGTGKAGKEAGWTPEQFEQAIAAAERRQDWDEAERLTAINEDLQLGSNANDTGNRTKFSQYKTPGGENYRERLLMLPDPSYKPGELKYNREESASRSGGIFWVFDAPEGKGLWQVPRSKYKTPAEALAYLNQEKGPSRVRFEGNHWTEKDVVAHTREQDFTDTEGSSVRLIEEIQSDWHQAGRKKGYMGEPLSEKEADEYYALKAEWMQGELSPAKNARYGDLLNRVNSTNEGAPDGPFKKTWHELGFKRALAEAVKDGKDKIAWVTGEQAADRFDLSKQVSRIEWQGLTSKPGQVLLSVFDTNGDTIMNEWQPASKLPDLIGKEVAEKIAAEPSGSLSGDGLKVGGAGMKGFYDKILPDFVKKYVKPWGGKVETTQIQTLQELKGVSVREPQYRNSDWVVTMNDGSEIHVVQEDANTKKDAIREAESIAASTKKRKGTVAVHSVTITPEMRKAIQAGQPMFMPKAKTGGALAEPGPTPPAPRRAAGALANTVDDEEESAMPSFGALR